MARAIANPEFTEKVDIFIGRASGALSNDFTGNVDLILNEAFDCAHGGTRLR